MCGKGRYGNELAASGPGRCIQCSKGKYSDSLGVTSDSTCKSCPTGRYGVNVGAEKPRDCNACLPGQYQDQPGQRECKICPKGFFQSTAGVFGCERCSSGRYVNVPGKNDCIDCGRGYFGCAGCTDDTQHPSPYTTGECTHKIVAGKTDPNSRGTCISDADCTNTEYPTCVVLDMVLCGGPQRSFKQLMSAYKIKPGRDCPDSEIKTKRLDFERRETCALCPSGWSQNTTATLACTRCPMGKYTGCPGYPDCLECSAGQTTYEKGSTKCVSKEMETSQPVVMPGSLKPKLTEEDAEGSLHSRIFSEYDVCIDWYTPLSDQPATVPDETTFESYFFQVSFESTFPMDQINNPGSDTNQTELPVSTPSKSVYCTCGSSDCDGTFTITIEGVTSGPIPETAGKSEIVSELLALTTVTDIEVNLWNEQACAPPENGTFSFTIGEVLSLSATAASGSSILQVTNHGCATMWDPLYQTLAFLRVRGYVQEAAGTPSIITPVYSIAPSCGDLMYLCRRCYPPNGPGAWQVGGPFNPEMRDWSCQPCPTGGDCRGAKLWPEVYAKFGYMRLGMEDFEDRKVAFWPCFKQKACLGGMIELPVGESPGTKFAYWTGPYEQSLDLWNKKGCNGNSDCEEHMEKYYSERKIQNDILKRPAVDCCSAIDPLMEDLAQCKEDPYNFQALSIAVGSLFVENLNFDTTKEDLMDLFKNSNPTSATISFTLPSENVPTSITLGWGTVYFPTTAAAKSAAMDFAHPQYNATLGFNPSIRGCHIDLTLVDDYEQCHVELGFRRHCNNTQSGKCRLCRACARGYWASGVSSCLTCPTRIMNLILIVFAFVAVSGMLYAFLASALEDSGAEAGSTVIHFSQGMQKIILNHIQLISLASGFPLKWPDEVNEMFYWMGLLGSAGSYVFNPACQDMELVEGEQKLAVALKK